MDGATVVQKFFGSKKNKNNLDMLKAAARILVKLIDNAQKPEEKYRCVRLGNPKVQQAIVEEEGAMEIMFLAGFTKMELDGESVLIYQPRSDGGIVARQIVQHLNAGTESMELIVPVAKTVTSSTTNSNKNNNGDTFLSEEERKRRQEKARAKRKAKAAEKVIAMKQWEEDKQQREEIKARNKALKAGFQENDSTKRHRKEDEENAPSSVEDYREMHRQRLLEKAAKEFNKSSPPVKSNDAMETINRAIPNHESAKPPPPTAAAAAAADTMDIEDDVEDQKPAAKVQPKEQEGYLDQFPLCAPSEGIRETSTFQSQYSNAVGFSPPCLGKLMRELDKMELPTDPRCPMFVRFDEETPQFIRALVGAALPGPSPYAGGLFAFDIYVPDDYPNVSPKVVLLTTGGGSVRFGPNLYATGKVCLSLLGTWPGPKWEPQFSNLTQVLISIQGLILGVQHPYYLEPGHGGWEGSVKDGDFSSIGHTLAGATITEDIKLPLEVAHYENIILQGTLKFALLEMLDAVTKDVKSLRYLRSFRRGIQFHLYHNRDLILSEMNNWESNANRVVSAAAQDQLSSDFDMDEMDTQNNPSSVAQLCSRLRSKLQALPQPNSLVADSDAMSLEAAEEDDDRKKAPAKHDQLETKPEDPVARIQRLIEEAAASGDYVKAGGLQSALETEQKAIADLQQSMKEAASDNNYIRAGKLQTQLEARMASLEELPNEVEKQSTAMGNLMGKKKTNGPAAGDPDDSFDDEDEMSAESDEEDMDEEAPPGPFGSHGTQTPNNNQNHQWGTGRTLKSDPSPQPQASSDPVDQQISNNLDRKLPAVARSPDRSQDDLCHLRIRLPNSTVLVEEFDAEETIADIYRRVDPQMEGEIGIDKSLNSNIAPVATRAQVMTVAGTATVQAPAFARPLSLKGYTLIMSHPKREFSLEMHGTKTIREMNLTSASLTVMKSAQRGVVKRGDLESRLGEAQGDAMDVDGLNYEALLELTQRVGASETDWGANEEAKLDQNSILMSPQEYLAALADGSEVENQQCPICLGEFDSHDTTPCIRQLKACSHSDRSFHESCLRTWLQTRSSCPICKTSVFGK